MTLSALGTFYIYPFFSEAIWNQIPVKKRHQLLLIYDFSVEKKEIKEGKLKKGKVTEWRGFCRFLKVQ